MRGVMTNFQVPSSEICVKRNKYCRYCSLLLAYKKKNFSTSKQRVCIWCLLSVL